MFLISGPCVIESEDLVFDTFGKLKEITDKLGIEYIAKSSFFKANRSSADSYAGPGLEKGLAVLQKAKKELDLTILTDVHEDTPLDEVADVVDVLQTPAFLVRQTSFIQKVASFGKPVNIKKGQWQAPWDMQTVVDKCKAVGNEDIWLCDRGTSFGFNSLINYMPGLAIMRETGCKIVIDATHSVQQPGSLGLSSGGNRAFVSSIARAAVAVGVDGVFLETHPCPEQALCDGPNMIALDDIEDLLSILVDIDAVVKTKPYFENRFEK